MYRHAGSGKLFSSRRAGNFSTDRTDPAPVTHTMSHMLDAAQLELLVNTVGVFYGGSQEQMAEADKTLDQLRSHPQPWCLLQQLVDGRVSPPAVLWSISLVEQHLKRRWRRVTDPERAACRVTVVSLVMAAAAAEGGEKVPAQRLQP